MFGGLCVRWSDLSAERSSRAAPLDPACACDGFQTRATACPVWPVHSPVEWTACYQTRGWWCWARAQRRATRSWVKAPLTSVVPADRRGSNHSLMLQGCMINSLIQKILVLSVEHPIHVIRNNEKNKDKNLQIFHYVCTELSIVLYCDCQAETLYNYFCILIPRYSEFEHWISQQHFVVVKNTIWFI